MILLVVLVFHNDFPFSHPFEDFQVAALDVPRAREALATLRALCPTRTHVHDWEVLAF